MRINILFELKSKRNGTYGSNGGGIDRRGSRRPAPERDALRRSVVRDHSANLTVHRCSLSRLHFYSTPYLFGKNNNKLLQVFTSLPIGIQLTHALAQARRLQTRFYYINKCLVRSDSIAPKLTFAEAFTN